MGKYVLITGASGGIGQAISLKLASEGNHLYLHYNQNESSIKELVTKLKPYGGEYYTIKADLSDPLGHEQLIKNVFSLDAIVHCAGNAHYGMLLDLQLKDVEALMRTHVTHPLMLTKGLLPKMMSKKAGNIVVISSIWGQTGAACEVAYSAAKGAQLAFVKALSKEVALSGIRVNAIAPGAINTAMLDGFSGAEMDLLKEEIPMGRLGLPEEVANATSFLLSDQSAYITGQVIGVNGGWYT
ncbi:MULTISPECIES: SDR family oxidoreductase [unclassified Bacillus (in: firmicutes)]|uniref:elongation factor P 5-aminopentanone reductase n=1 Tax=unclassified Bacillus (in: firmicutes) TaxID=185979 RepID=UPI0008E40FC9|nr:MULTISPECIES: SDR family oxidoreductase [unclassified Bacillus (in: firmicutes)]SFA73123.1 3-oxoacyl-[acyl-carrier protein] reductase [Bacillus sp. UNCCL13]SFQ63240.1 3-oxoacyl-[acyl-carrier protein] reductase [Bacillus sp. cl95]